MQKSVLKADKKLAETLWQSFEAINKEKYNGKSVFKRNQLKNGFEITSPSMDKDEKGKRKRIVIFRFTKRNAGMQIEWDEKYVTIRYCRK